MLSVIRVHLPSEIPILGCELTPYVLVRRSDGSISSSDIPETAPAGGYYLNYRWFRIQNDNQAAVCSVHPAELATLQCLGCLKAKVPINKSYHCSSKCFADSWRYHRALHSRSVNPVQENGTEEEELFGCFSSTGSSIADTSKFAGKFASKMGLSNGSVISGIAPVSERSGGDETWYEVGCCRTYTPTSDDVGHVLKLECTAVEASAGKAAGPASVLLTARVIPAPSPTPRRMIPVNTLDGLASMEFEGRSTSTGTFSVLSYNILADLYATNEMYSYCPPWALSWAYRRQNLLREILGYGADILCLQEVQSDHFDEVFAPELEKHGYMAVYKKKTAELYVGSAYAIDGCATFFRKDRFSLVKKYEVEFNKAAQSLTEAVVPASQRKTALSRLLKDNVALIAVLEAKTTVRGSDGPSVASKRQLICVANTHIHANPELKDVKLWQVHTLLKGLEKIAASADIPMLVCGDFNSIPGSAPHSLLASGRVDPSHPDLSTDPLGILRPASKLSHQLPLVSAYSGLSTIPGLNPGLDCQRRSLDPTSNEPLFTNCSRDFLGTLDYIFFTADSLTVESLLELLDEESLRKDTALPSPEWSSDHIALLAEFRCNPRLRR